MQYNQTVDDCGSHFGSNLLHRISIKVALNQLAEAVQLHCSYLQTHVFVYME